jgi:preprotein translocase subunit SecE
MSKREQMMVLAVIALAALFLYPLALGWGDWDLYQPGWGSWGMLLALLLICLACWANGLWVLPTLVALAMIAWSLDLMESGNLWDYLLDPWLSAFALGRVFIKCLQFALRRFR